ncbi:carboxypeptidase regulatory-like domain-containing protein [Pyxidicoccus xibeiensis]|uniref:carboxypeptidase regulatory-like domain-containing protein n=1 Tax=Pyxidicoccus xibeiensis TaxID=2906759 RepID=UPI0020A830FE|nr:carboxypeptidase regulatory-like domain-containing protein [Pyxidicoccus xibeiensis]MCP3140474.1 carboxypeptidase regulatory-like domain-containing protein [Pyxidicoccus xibeiensis]
MTLRTLGLTLLGAAGLLALPACQKESAPPPPAAPTAAEQPSVRAPEAREHAATPIQDPNAPAAAPEAVAAPPGRGVVRGTVTFTGAVPAPAELPPSSDAACEGRAPDAPVQAKGGKLANVLVRVRGTVPGSVATPTAPVMVDQSKCTYVPRVQGALVGQPVLFKNSDGTLHNTRGMAGKKAAFNIAQPPAGTPVQKPLPTDSDVLKLKCDIHPWMTAYVVSNPNPFFVTTGEDGAFTLQGLPAGTYTVEAWHETLGTKTAEVIVKDDAPAEASFAFSMADASATK